MYIPGALKNRTIFFFSYSSSSSPSSSYIYFYFYTPSSYFYSHNSWYIPYVIVCCSRWYPLPFYLYLIRSESVVNYTLWSIRRIQYIILYNILCIIQRRLRVSTHSGVCAIAAARKFIRSSRTRASEIIPRFYISIYNLFTSLSLFFSPDL